jgi:hypothetical protein
LAGNAAIKMLRKPNTSSMSRILFAASILVGFILGVSTYLLGADALGVDQPEASVTFLDPQPLSIPVSGDGKLLTAIAVRNVGSSPGRAEFCTLGEKSSDCVHNVDIVGASGKTFQVAPGQVISLSIQISQLQAPMSGYLGLLTYAPSGTLESSSFRQLKVSVPLFPRIAWVPIVTGILIGLLLCLFSARRLEKGEPQTALLDRIGSPAWDFSKSWASNVTVVGALFSTALAIVAVPDLTHHINKGGYALLNVLFTLLVVMAPFVFNVLRKPIITAVASPDGSNLQYQGFVVSFLVASGVTMWAVIGELVTLIIMIDEFVAAGLTPSLITRCLQGLIAILAIAVTLYGGITMVWTARSQVIERKNTLKTLATARGVSEESIGHVQTRLSDWALL